MIERHVETIFCDDIRQEISGKISYIGVYSSMLFVNAFPITLPKLCLSVKVVTPASNPLQSLKIRVLKDEEIMQEINIDENVLTKSAESAKEIPDDDDILRIKVFNSVLIFSPLELTSPCHITVRAFTEEGEMRGTALSVAQLPSDYKNSSPK